MAWVHGEIVIGRPAAEVFDYVADQSNEPEYNPRMRWAEKVTAGPVGEGTRFRSGVCAGRHMTPMLIECTRYQRPKLLATRTKIKQADISYVLRFDPAAGGTRMSWSGRVRPKGALRLLGPTITWRGNRQERRTWASLKARLEAPR
jgi:hypothetical protein